MDTCYLWVLTPSKAWVVSLIKKLYQNCEVLLLFFQEQVWWFKLGPSSMIAISMYQRSGASDISPIQSFGVSIQIRPTLTLWSETYIGCAFINTVIAKTVDPTLLIGKILIRTDDICVGVGLFDWLFLHQDVKMIEYLILIKYQTPLRYSPSLITHITFRHLLSDILHVHYTVHVCSKNRIC